MADNDPTQYPDDRLADAERLLATPIGELFDTIGRTRRRSGEPGEDPRSAGKRFYETAISRCRNGICANAQVRSFCLHRPTGHLTHLVCAIADMILEAVGAMIPAMTVAAILVQSGLEALCKAHWHT